MRNNNYKYGEITNSILDYVEYLGEASFTDMNKFYHQNTQFSSNYDPIKNRGGSFCHHLVSLRQPRRRAFDGRSRWLVKQLNGKWKVLEV